MTQVTYLEDSRVASEHEKGVRVSPGAGVYQLDPTSKTFSFTADAAAMIAFTEQVANNTAEGGDATITTYGDTNFEQELNKVTFSGVNYKTVASRGGAISVTGTYASATVDRDGTLDHAVTTDGHVE